MARWGGNKNDSLLGWVLQDLAANKGYRDSQLILAWFRLAQWALLRWGLFGRLFCAIYRLFTSLFLAVELPVEANIGPRLRTSTRTASC